MRRCSMGLRCFNTQGYVDEAPDPHNLADLDGDADADVADAMLFELFLLGPGVPAVGLARGRRFRRRWEKPRWLILRSSRGVSRDRA
jgi:hypothetical protein